MTIKFAALMAVALCGAAPTARADEVNLLFGTTLPAQVHLNMRVLHPWAEKINEQGKGVVHIDVRDGSEIANLGNFYSRVQDDVIQISWGLQSAIGGKFPRTAVGGLPFEVEKAEIGSVALWRVYKSGLFNAEYDTVQPLYMITFPPSGIHYAKQPKTFDDLKGLKLATGSKVDAVLVQWTAFQPFKLQDVTFYHLETKLGGATGMVFMAKKKYDALPAAAKKILDDNSGEAESRFYGKFWDDVDNEGRDMVKALGDKHKIIPQAPEIAAKWRKAVAPVIDDFVKATPDGEKVLAAFRAETAKVKAGN
jgi:TRAP-type C4-dicarboxylate transport system substrate-binding protein